MRTIIKTSQIRYFFGAICLFFLGTSTGFTQLTDDFSDGDFTANPIWSGTTGTFIVNGVNQLQSNGNPAAADTLYLTTTSVAIDSAEWKFYMHLDFNPTASTNFVKIYLVSDQADLTGALNGYYLRIGETGSSDTLELWRQDGTVNTLILTGNVSYGATFDATIKVTRDPSGNWTLYSDPTAGTSYITEGSVLDNTHTITQFFGFYCKYSTVSRFNMYYFDDVSIGQIVGDTSAPSISSVTVMSNTQLDVLFSEPVDPITAQTATNYSVSSSIGNPTTAVQDGFNPALVHLTFGSPFVNGQTDTLTVQNVEDLATNIMVTETQTFFYFIAGTPSYRNVVINEILADPTPQIGLPAADYIELFNASDSIFDLAGWVFSDASSSATLPTYILQPGQYVIITDDNYTFDFSFYPNVIFVPTMPSLNISGDDLSLRDNLTNLIDQVSYSDTWYQDPIKKGGGYSLELINPILPCLNSSNWIASNHPYGGTPGVQNSVYDPTPDVIAPSILTSNLISSVTVDLCFDESLDTTNILASQFTCSGGVSIMNVSMNANTSCLTVTLSPALDTGIVYTLTLNGMGDCSGNMVSNITFEIILPHTGKPGDLIINEILFNPYTGGDDFVEIYNNSDKYIDLIDWKLANWDNGTVSNYKTITSHYLMNPKDYVVLTKDSTNIQDNYLNSVLGTFVQMSTFPTYSNDSGTVFLILPDFDSSICDYFSYNEGLQFALINNPDGISLERLDFNRETNDPTNWHSAAENVGWATPGFENSQYFPGQLSEGMISVEPEIFSPDNDGVEDVLNINYLLDAPGYVGNVTVFDANGREVRYLTQNELLAAEGTISWDGLNNKREKSRIGMYIIYFEVFDLEGNVSGVKKSCVLASKFQ